MFGSGWGSCAPCSLAYEASETTLSPFPQLFYKPKKRKNPMYFGFVVFGAEGGTRTHTPFRALDPKSSETANSSTSALPVLRLSPISYCNK